MTDAFRRPPHRHRLRRAARDARRRRLRLRRRPDGCGGAARDPDRTGCRELAARGRLRARGARRAARARRPEHGAALDDRARLLRHDHARGDPAQRAREPELVHRLHAVPAGDLAGPARSAHQLPDHGHRSHRSRDGERVDARRGDRGRRGDAAGPPRIRILVPRVPGRRRRSAADEGAARAPGRGRRHRTRRGRLRRRRRRCRMPSAPPSSTRARPDASGIRPPSSRRSRRRAASRSSPPTCSRSPW